jgi:ribose 5-phosphate isomerase A
MSADTYKLQAAERALEFVMPGMKLGLGTGSTMAKFIDLLAVKVGAGLDIMCVPTSEITRVQASKLGIPLTTLDDHPDLDLTIDGADEIDDNLRLIKGGGGALLREKIVALASERMVVIADDSKLVDTLGAFPLPVEVEQFGLKVTLNMIEEFAADVGCVGEMIIRHSAQTGKFFKTDGGNLIVDCAFGAIDDPDMLGDALESIPGVIEHGLFIDIADMAIIAGENGVQLLIAEDEV